MRSRLSLALSMLMFGFSVSVLADGPQLQNPTPAPSKASKKTETHPQQSAQKPNTKDNESRNAPLSVTLNGPVTIEKSERDRNDDREKSNDKASSEWWLSLWTFCLVLVTLALAVITAILARYTYKLWDETNKSATRQIEDTKTQLSIAQQSANAAIQSARSLHAADRAYIKMSHIPPGLIFNIPLQDRLYGEGNPRTGEVKIEVSNLGKTPAIMTSVFMTYFTLPLRDPLPPLPPYDMGRSEKTKMKTILYGTDAITPTPTFKPTLIAEEFTSINDKTSRLYLLMYADYIDQFGVRHRAGYARRYDPESHGNNLVLITQRDYNYDRQRQQGEGDDWEET